MDRDAIARAQRSRQAQEALEFERDKAFGMHLDIPAGTAVRFEPGESKEVTLVAFGGSGSTKRRSRG